MSKKQISRLKNGETFLDNHYYYEATNEWKEETSQRYCKKLAFLMDGVWHGTSGGDWYNIYYDVDLATMEIGTGKFIVSWKQKPTCDEKFEMMVAYFESKQAAVTHYKSLLRSFGPIEYIEQTIAQIIEQQPE